MSFNSEFQTMIDSFQNLLYVLTFEERRCEKEMCAIAEAGGNTFLMWDIWKGLCDKDGKVLQVPIPPDPDLPAHEQEELFVTIKDPGDVLSYMIQTADEKTMIVLRDYHPFLEKPEIIRGIREFLNHCSPAQKFLVIESPIKKIPLEFSKQIHVMNFLYPNKQEIKDFLTNPLYVTEMELTDKLLEQCARALQGLTIEEIRDVVSVSLVEKDCYDVDTFLSYKKQIIKRDDILEYFETNETMNNVGGMDKLKSWITVAGRCFDENAKDFGTSPPRGILLLGIPGTGKSLTAKVIGNLWDMPVIRFDIGKVMDKLVGSSESRMRSALQLIEALQPAVVWIDEIEKSLAGMGSSDRSDGGTTSRVVSTLLTWSNDHKADIFMVATANSLSTFESNPELLRAGRFDAIFFSDLPQANERKEIFSIHLKKKKRDASKFDLDALSAATEGYTGAEIEQIVKEALKTIWATGGGLRDIDTQSLLDHVEEVVPLSKTMKEQIRKMQDWAETRAKRTSSLEVDGTKRVGKIKIIE